MKTQKSTISKTIFFISLLLTLIAVMGCNKSDDSADLNSDCLNWSENFLAQANLYSEAAMLYANNPTIANCQSYKTAGLNYIASLEDAIDCVPSANVQAYQNDLDEYRAEVNAIDCN